MNLCNCNTTTPYPCQMHDKPNFGEGWPEEEKTIKLNRAQRRKLGIRNNK